MDRCAFELLKSIPCNETNVIRCALFDCGIAGDMSSEHIIAYILDFDCVTFKIEHTYLEEQVQHTYNLTFFIHVFLLIFLLFGILRWFVKSSDKVTKVDESFYYQKI